MTSLKEILAKSHGITTTATLDRDQIYADYFVPRTKAWMSLPEGERRWSPEAIEHARKTFAGEYKQPRKGRLSPSSIGVDCERELLFAYDQAPQTPVTPRSQEVMDSGSFEHLRHQMMGLSAGYLTGVEIFVHEPDKHTGGSADGQGDDRSLWEFKNTAPHLFGPISKGPEFLGAALEREIKQEKYDAASYAAHMVLKHKLQMECYWWIDELEAVRTGRPRHFSDFGSLVYQNRESKALYEIRIKSAESRRRAVQSIVDSAADWIDLNELPDFLEGCAKVFAGDPVTSREERRHLSCHYRKHCPKATSVLLQ